MTRINLVPPSELSDQHLLAELRELPRIFSLVRKNGIQPEKIPEKFCLGTGHVNFFRNKLAFLSVRYEDLYSEYESRGFEFNYSHNLSYDCDSTIWVPSKEDIELSRKRLQEKIDKKPNWYRWTNANLL